VEQSHAPACCESWNGACGDVGNQSRIKFDMYLNLLYLHVFLGYDFFPERDNLLSEFSTFEVIQDAIRYSFVRPRRSHHRPCFRLACSGPHAESFPARIDYGWQLGQSSGAATLPGRSVLCTESLDSFLGIRCEMNEMALKCQ
jgi:hypothetical protein